MEILLVVGGLVVLFVVIKFLMFLPNKSYLEQVLGALRALGAPGMADMLDASTAGKMGPDVGKQAWTGLSESRSAGISPEDCARGMIEDWQRH